MPCFSDGLIKLRESLCLLQWFFCQWQSHCQRHCWSRTSSCVVCLNHLAVVSKRIYTQLGQCHCQSQALRLSQTQAVTSVLRHCSSGNFRPSQVSWWHGMALCLGYLGSISQSGLDERLQPMQQPLQWDGTRENSSFSGRPRSQGKTLPSHQRVVILQWDILHDDVHLTGLVGMFAKGCRSSQAGSW